MKQEFEKRYKTYPLEKLLKILEDRDQYDPLAIEVAEQELAQRNIATEEIEAIQLELRSTKEKDQVYAGRFDKLQSVFRKTKTSFINFVHPLKAKTAEDTIIGIAIFMFLFGLHQIYLSANSWFSYGEIPNSYEEVQYIGLVCLFPIAIGILLWRKEPLGWLLCMSYLVYNVVMEGTNVFIEAQVFGYVEESNEVWFVLIYWLVFVVLLYFLLRKSTRELLPVKQSYIIVFLAIVLAYSIWQSISYYNYIAPLLFPEPVSFPSVNE